MGTNPTEFIITLKVKVNPERGYAYVHPVLWKWTRAIQRQVPHTTEVEVLNCSPLQMESEEKEGWVENLDQQQKDWEEGRYG